MRFRAAIVLAMAFAIQFRDGAVSAHHSFASEFDSSTAVTVQGVVTGVEMVSPHSFIYLDVKTHGGVVRWALEGLPPVQVRRKGLALDFIKPGDELGACGYVTKSGAVSTRAEPITARASRKLQAAVLTMPQGEKLVWNNYRQGKCVLDY